jgi:hypothetical protein
MYSAITFLCIKCFARNESWTEQVPYSFSISSSLALMSKANLNAHLHAICRVSTQLSQSPSDGSLQPGLEQLPSLCPSAGSVTTVAAGSSHTCAASSDGGLWCWGLDTNGQLGNINTADLTRQGTLMTRPALVRLGPGN